MKKLARVALGIVVLYLLVSAVPSGAAPLPPGGTFRDDDGNFHEGNIEAIAAEGITTGCKAPDLYCPAAEVTRGQMAAFLDRALHFPATTVDYFTDDGGSPFEGAINRLAAAGKAIVLVSSELGELIGMSDRIVMLCEGRVGGVFARAEATQERLLAAAMGRFERAA